MERPGVRKVCYVSGSRADFGLMEHTLRVLTEFGRFDVSIAVTGMHLSALFGNTVQDVERSGIRIAGRVAACMDALDGAGMARSIADELKGLVDLFNAERPDVVLLLGDRGEMLAGAIAGIHLNRVVAHIHGGEISGTVDEPVRHAISKLAHYHFTATEGARDRLIRMGENPKSVFVVGAPGLDSAVAASTTSKSELCRRHDIDPTLPLVLLIYHPVLQSADAAGSEMELILEAALSTSAQVLCVFPNSDAGSEAIRNAIRNLSGHPRFRTAVHLQRQDFLSWMSVADVMLGNSSSGIIEAASFGLPVVNVGDRQHGRERSGNVQDAPLDRGAIRQALISAFQNGHRQTRNVYGDGQAGIRIAHLLDTLPLSGDILRKQNAF